MANKDMVHMEINIGIRNSLEAHDLLFHFHLLSIFLSWQNHMTSLLIWILPEHLTSQIIYLCCGHKKFISTGMLVENKEFLTF